MKLEYGYIKRYNAAKGYGFVTRTFDNTIRQDNNDRDVFFHITAIKDKFPNLAQQLDKKLGRDVYFWYLIDTSERDKVEQIWLDINDVPNPYQKELFSYIERLSNYLPSFLEQINVGLVTKARKEKTPTDNLSKPQEINEAKLLKIETKEVDNNRIIRDKEFYAGLPEDLINSVFWVEREFRTNPRSHVKGGHNLIFEFYDDRILEYDWVDFPCAYLRRIICNAIGCELNEFNHLGSETIMNILEKKFYRIFIKQYRDDGSPKLFHEVWNSDTFDSIPSFLILRPYEVEIYCDTEKDILDFFTELKNQQIREEEEYRARRRRTART